MRWIKESQYTVLQMVDFVFARLRGFPKWLGNEAMIKVNSLKARFLSMTGGGGESFFADSLLASRQIERRYRPKLYDGNVTLICPGSPHNQLGWSQAVSGDLQLIEITIPDQDYHAAHLTKEPAVSELADKLRQLIDQSM